MNFWQLLSYAAWIVSGLLFLWMLVDMVSVAKAYDEDFLMSSREGADELMDQQMEQQTQQGGHADEYNR